MNRPLARLCTVTLAALAAVLLFAAPALAHTEISVDKAQAGATDVTLTVAAEAENSRAGISSVRMVLPEGIAPSQVSLASGPAGWTLSQSADGFAVGGPPLKAGVAAKFVVKVAQLPANATTLAFKTLVQYTDGTVDRWIELPSASNPNPDNPAPVVSLQPAAVAPTTAPPTTEAPTTEAPSPTPTTAGPQAKADPTPASTVGWLVGGLVLLVLVAVAGLLVARRRRGGSTPA